LNKNAVLYPGQIIYLQPKRRNAKDNWHIVQKGETMWEISQKYGIKLKRLYQLNQMIPGTEPKPGQKLLLRKKPK
jgi:LysM repeat protein